jgi:hypothetical protein
LGTAISLLTSLNNPKNITLLTSQLLSAPALWTRQESLSSALNFMTLFHSAAIRCHQREFNDTHLSMRQWTLAVVKGADQHSSPSHHLLAIAGLIIGLASCHQDFHSTNLASTLQQAFVRAVNLALLEQDGAAHPTICLAANHAFSHLSDWHRSSLDYDRLLPVLMTSTFHSPACLHSGSFLAAVDADVHHVSSQQLGWPVASTSYQQIEAMLKSPLISSLGPLSRLIAHSIESVHDAWLVRSAVEDLADLSKRLQVLWRQNKLSEMDASHDAVSLDEQTRKVTTPALWRLLRSTLFALVVILRSAMGRVVRDASLATHDSIIPPSASKLTNIC